MIRRSPAEAGETPRDDRGATCPPYRYGSLWSVEVVGLCDVDSNAMSNATALFPNAKTYADYRELLKEMEDQIDAVVVSTPDHTHAPASLMAMEMNKAHVGVNGLELMPVQLNILP